MARIPAIATVAPKPWRVLQGPGAIEIGPVPSNDPTGMGSVVTVGLTDSSIGWNPNIETAILTSDQMYNPHGAKETAWSHQLSFALDQADIWNLTLACSYDQSAVSASSMLELDGSLPSPYRCVRVTVEGAKSSADDSVVTQLLDFWKAKIVASGEIMFGRTVKTTIPVLVHGLGNSSDKVGALSIDAAQTPQAYE
jgi:hypothetical protein